MKRTFFLFTLLLIVLWGGMSVASAHVIKKDGDISVLLHIDPDDEDTVAGTASHVLFNIGQPGAGFDMAGCACLVTISEGGKQLLKSTLTVLSNEDGGVDFTFPEKGTYVVQLTGTPNAAARFAAPFLVSFDVEITHVLGEATTKPAAITFFKLPMWLHHMGPMALELLAPLGFMGWLLYDRLSQGKKAV